MDGRSAEARFDAGAASNRPFGNSGDREGQAYAQRAAAGTGAIKDAVQVAVLSRWAACRDAAGTLGACFAAPEGLTEAEREACLREEGWVLGA